MAVLNLGFTSEDADATYRLPLDGSLFTFRVVYNEQLAGWYFDLYDSAGVPVVLGRRMVPGLCPVTSENGPAGALFVYGTKRSQHESVSLGRDLDMLYFEEGTTYEEMVASGVSL